MRPLTGFSCLILITVALQPPVRAGWAIVCNDGNVQLKDVPASLSSEIAAAREKKQDIKSVALTPTGGWIVLVGKNGFITRGIPGKAFDKVGELAKQGVELKSITFGPAAAWVILYDKSGFQAGGIPEDCSAKLGELAASGAELKSVALAPKGGWAVVSDRNHSASHDIPAEAADRFHEFEKQNADIKAIVFTPSGGWGVIADQNTVFCRNVPDDAYKSLLEAGRQKETIRSVAFSADFLRLSQDDPATRKNVLDRMARAKVTGMSVAIIDNNQIVAAHGYGVVEAGGAPANEETRFQAGSVSKPVASLGALRLVAKQMLTRQQPGGWGLGIEVDGAGTTLRFSHNGVNAGFLTQMIGYVQSGKGVVVMVNSGGDAAGALMADICQNVGIEYGWPD